MMKYIAACYTDKGKRKGVNQDSLLVKHVKYRGQEVVLAVICDGMGGLERGEVASAEVAHSFAGWFQESFQQLSEEEEFEDKLYDSWEILFQEVHRNIKEYGQLHGIRIGTTATAMLLWKEHFYIAHIGDCRIYEIKEQLRQLTKDQVQGELMRGDSCKETEKAKQRAHILLQGAGVSKTLRPVYYSGEVKKNAVYLLCTDGFRHKISESEFHKAFFPEKMTDEMVMRKRGERIARMAMDRGEKDNISVILLRTISENEKTD